MSSGICTRKSPDNRCLKVTHFLVLFSTGRPKVAKAGLKLEVLNLSLPIAGIRGKHHHCQHVFPYMYLNVCPNISSCWSLTLYPLFIKTLEYLFLKGALSKNRNDVGVSRISACAAALGFCPCVMLYHLELVS